MSGRGDFKLIFRDPSLRAFLFFPIMLFAIIIWFVPSLIEKYEILEDYIPLFIMVGAVENTQMFSFISSMVLIDEKETQVAQMYGIVPLSRIQFLLFRLLIPYSFTVLLNVILLLTQPFVHISFIYILLISILTALIVPAYVLGINSIVKNRMEGMIYIKAFNMLVLVPFAAFFVPENFKHVFGFLPTHWILQSIELVSIESPQNGNLLLFLLIGFVFFAGVIYWLARSFFKKHFS